MSASSPSRQHVPLPPVSGLTQWSLHGVRTSSRGLEKMMSDAGSSAYRCTFRFSLALSAGSCRCAWEHHNSESCRGADAAC